MQCINNMKQIGLAMHNFHNNNNAFPYGSVTPGQAVAFWGPRLLPFIEQANTFNAYNLSVVYNVPANSTAGTTQLASTSARARPTRRRRPPSPIRQAPTPTGNTRSPTTPTAPS